MSSTSAALARTQAVSPLLIFMTALSKPGVSPRGAPCYGRVSSRAHR